MSFTSRLIVAIGKAEADGFTNFAAGLRELLRREQGASVVTVEPSIARDRCESPHMPQLGSLTHKHLCEWYDSPNRYSGD